MSQRLSILFILVMLTSFLPLGCASSNQAVCPDEDVAYSFHENSHGKYIFGKKNFMPFEGYIELQSFVPDRAEIAIVDSFLTANKEINHAIEFTQYGGFITSGEKRIIAVNKVYDDTKEYSESHCRWFFGLGPYFEQNTQQFYVNMEDTTFYELR